jgi:succinate dehydrogenase/fumarate reductase flavoprotein subunit
VAYRAGAVVLATGGAAQLFPLSSTPGEITGDGYGMAFRAGAELVNLEYMQFMWRLWGTQTEPTRRSCCCGRVLV